MFNEATNYLPATNTDTHALVAYGNFGIYGPGTKARLFSFASFDLALAGYEAAVAHAVKNGSAESDARMIFAVRSMDDPTVKATGVPVEQYVPYSVIASGVRKAIRDEEAETVKWTIEAATRAAEHGAVWTFGQMVAHAKESLDKRGFKPERWAIEDALKARVTIGRCRGCETDGRGRRAFFFKKSTGARLCDTRCPRCGSKLSQTSLALDAPFYFLSDPVDTFFDKRLDRLPGESQADVGRRLDRLHEAMEV